MPSLSNKSRKRSLTEVTRDENEDVDQINEGRRQRYPTERQKQMSTSCFRKPSFSEDVTYLTVGENEASKLRARIVRQKKELAKHKQKLAEYHGEGKMR